MTPALSLAGLAKSFGRNRAVDNLTWMFGAGGYSAAIRIGIRAGGKVLDRGRPEVMAAVSEKTA